jgi:diadenosine tetraphosphate (Ap4A) HIT family hydrolase
MKVLDSRRAKYIKRVNCGVKRCIFCDPKVIKDQECKSLTGKYWRVMVNKYPYLDGNLMIIPKRHFTNLEEMNKAERDDFFDVLIKAKKKIGKIFRTQDFNIGLNLGKAAGTSIDHLHWQIIPRDPKAFFNSANIFGDLYVIKISPNDLKKMIEKN